MNAGSLVVLATVAACGSFSGAPSDEAHDAAAPEGATHDAAAPAVDGGPDGANEHPNGDFEFACTPWDAYRSVSTHLTTPVRSGAGACRFCVDGTHANFGADDLGVIADPVVGAEYRAEAWVHVAPGRTAPPAMRIILRTLSAPGAPVESAQGDGPAPKETWQRLAATLRVTKPAPKLAVAVNADTDGGECFVLDDVVVVRAR